MVFCRFLKRCPFFHNPKSRAQVPGAADTLCKQKNPECAIYKVYKALGRDEIPDNLLPNEMNRVEDILRVHSLKKGFQIGRLITISLLGIALIITVSYKPYRDKLGTVSSDVFEYLEQNKVAALSERALEYLRQGIAVSGEAFEYIKKHGLKDMRAEGPVSYLKRSAKAPEGFEGKGFFLVSSYRFKVGGKIDLEFEIASHLPDMVPIYKERWKSLILTVGPRSKVHSAPTYMQLIGGEAPDMGRSGVEQVSVDEEHPFNMRVRGIILKDEETGGVIFDFAEFGRFAMLKSDYYLVSGRWIPPRPTFFDFFRKYESEITIVVKDI